jgi:hypothetical protein
MCSWHPGKHGSDQDQVQLTPSEPLLLMGAALHYMNNNMSTSHGAAAPIWHIRSCSPAAAAPLACTSYQLQHTLHRCCVLTYRCMPGSRDHLLPPATEHPPPAPLAHQHATQARDTQPPTKQAIRFAVANQRLRLFHLQGGEQHPLGCARQALAAGGGGGGGGGGAGGGPGGCSTPGGLWWAGGGRPPPPPPPIPPGYWYTHPGHHTAQHAQCTHNNMMPQQVAPPPGTSQP